MSPLVRLECCKDYLRRNCHRNVPLRELVALTGMSEGHLIRSFKRREGLTPHSWLLAQRISLAIPMIERQPLADIAHGLGFADQSHFTRCFKAMTGMTPAAFRGRAARNPNAVSATKDLSRRCS